MSARKELVISVVGHLVGLNNIASGGHDLDSVVGMDDAGAENDGGNAAISGCAQAQNKAQRARLVDWDRQQSTG
jgi:hypothetical protein